MTSVIPIWGEKKDGNEIMLIDLDEEWFPLGLPI